jgi:hypothetical protein
VKTSIHSGRVALLVLSVILFTIRLSFFCNDLLHNCIPDSTNKAASKTNSSTLLINQPSFGELASLNTNDQCSASDFISNQPVDDVKTSSKINSVPALKKRNKLKEKMIIDNEKGKIFSSINNSEIIVPRYAFIDNTGQPVEGNIDLTYSEYLNPYEIFLSGIPMHYDSAGNELLESAGMIEINAMHNGTDVYPNPDRLVKITLAKNVDPDYNFYFFDRQNNQWKFEINTNASPQANTIAFSPPVFPEDYTSTIPDYYAIVKCEAKINGRPKFLFFGKRTPDQFIFTFVSKGNTFPEINKLKNIHWVYSGEDAVSVCKSLFRFSFNEPVPEEFYFCEDISIKKKKDSYVLSITNKGANFSIDINPWFENKNDRKYFEQSFPAYQLALQYRNSEKEFLARKFRNDSALYSGLNKAFIQPNSIPVVFYINRFGTWNCDRPFKPDLPVMVSAEFIDAAGKIIPVDTGWMVLTSRNTLLRVNDFDNFRFNPLSANIFFTQLPGNRIGIVYAHEFSIHNSGKKEMQFRIIVYDSPEEGENALRRAIAIGTPDS